MSITYQCERCGKWYTVREGKVGTLARCKDCDFEMVVPNSPDLFDDQIDGPSGGAATPRRGTTVSAAPLPPRRPAPPPSPTGGESQGKFWSRTLGVIGFMLFLALKVGLRMPFPGNQRPPRPQFANPMPIIPNRQPQIQPPPPLNLKIPIEVPKSFPDLGPGREIEPGVMFYEVRLRPDANRQPPPPGQSGRLWLYLPKPAQGARAPRSLACVLMAPPGSNMLTGAKLAVDNRPEHIPYVKAGFAVLAFDLDGAEPNRRGAFPWQNMMAFLKSRSGLANGRIAIEFLKAKVPQVDPNRLYVAGHSSAGTFALLLAEYEPSLKGCVAYAPVVDLAEHVKKTGMSPFIDRNGFTELVTTLSPRTRESNLPCPVFLFHARDDETVDFSQTTALADRLKSLGKPVTLDLANEGGHYQPMLDVGIPHGIEWLKKRDAEVKQP